MCGNILYIQTPSLLCIHISLLLSQRTQLQTANCSFTNILYTPLSNLFGSLFLKWQYRFRSTQAQNRHSRPLGAATKLQQKLHNVLYTSQPADWPHQVQCSVHTAATSWEQGQEGLMISRTNINHRQKKEKKKTGD